MSHFRLRQRTTLAAPSVTYDTSIGNGVDTNGYADLPLKSGAKYIYVGTGGSDANTGLSHAQRKATISAAQALVSDQAGDQVLIAQGSSFSEQFSNFNNCRGFSLLYPTVFQSYDPNDPTNTAKYGRATGSNRPVLNTGANGHLTFWPGGGTTTIGYLAFRGIDWNPGNVNDITILNQNAGPGILFENCILRYTGISFQNTATSANDNHILRNCSFYGSHSSSGTGGHAAYLEGCHTTIEDCVFYHCGWKIGLSRDDATYGTTMFKHVVYRQRGTNGTVRRNIFMEGPADAGKWLGSGDWTENLVINCPLVQLGGGDNYDTNEPGGVTINCQRNAFMGMNDINTSNARAIGIYTRNATASSEFAHNLFARSQSPSGVVAAVVDLAADFNVPSYCNFHDNVSYLAVSGRPSINQGGSFPAQDLLTTNNNAWDDSASGTNVNIASHTMPNPYTLAQLYSALTSTFGSITDEASFINYVTNNPEAHAQRTALALLRTGYAVA